MSKIKKKDTLGIIGIFNLIRQKREQSYSLKIEHKNLQYLDSGVMAGQFEIYRERERTFSLGFRPFGPLVLDGARSKVDLRGEGYAWRPIWWSSDNSKR